MSIASAQRHQQRKTDSVNGQLFSNTRYTRASLASTSEVDRRSSTARKEAKRVRVTLDNDLTFTQHCNNIAVNVQQRNNYLNALAGSTLRSDKESLPTTYQAIGRSIISYCCPVWTPSLKDTNMSLFNGHKIQRWELPLAVLKWQMSPNCIKRFGNYQFASITNWFQCSSPA